MTYVVTQDAITTEGLLISLSWTSGFTTLRRQRRRAGSHCEGKANVAEKVFKERVHRPRDIRCVKGFSNAEQVDVTRRHVKQISPKVRLVTPSYVLPGDHPSTTHVLLDKPT